MELDLAQVLPSHSAASTFLLSKQVYFFRCIITNNVSFVYDDFSKRIHKYFKNKVNTFIVSFIVSKLTW